MITISEPPRSTVKGDTQAKARPHCKPIGTRAQRLGSAHDSTSNNHLAQRIRAQAATNLIATCNLINNPGDLGKTLNDLGSQENVKALVTAMVTGGVVSGLGNAFTVNVNGTPVPLNQVSMGAGASASQVLARNLVTGTAQAVVGTAINGGSLGDNLTQAIAGGFIATGSALAAFEIGSNTAPGSFANFAGHAIAGCAGGALRANGGCGAGALGAVLGEATALMLNGNRSAEDILANGVLPGTNELASVVGAMGVALAGGDAQQINLAAGAAANAAENNLAGQVRMLADAALRLAQGGWQAVSPAGQAALMRCAATPWCASLPLVAAGMQRINEAQRLADQPSLADQIPTGYGSAIPLPNPAPTTTPGTAVAGNTSTAGSQLDQVGGPTTTGGTQIGAAAPAGSAPGGFGAGGVPVISPVVMNINGQDQSVNLPSTVTPDRALHILTGDSTGGGHLWPGLPDKTPFPQSWDAGRILGEVSAVASDPSSTRTPSFGGRTVVTGTRDGVVIRVIVGPGGNIITGTPTSLPRNPG